MISLHLLYIVTNPKRLWINWQFPKYKDVVVALKPRWVECWTLERWSYVSEMTRSKEWKLDFCKNIFLLICFKQEGLWIFILFYFILWKQGKFTHLTKCNKMLRRGRFFGFPSHHGMILVSINTTKTPKGLLS